jgi:hypothetical protein
MKSYSVRVIKIENSELKSQSQLNEESQTEDNFMSIVMNKITIKKKKPTKIEFEI